MRNGGYIGDIADLETHCVQSAYRGIPSGPGPFDFDFQVPDAHVHRILARPFSGNLGRKRRTLARTAETGATCGSPAQGVALAVADGDDGVVERGVDVCDAFRDILLRTLLAFSACTWISHILSLLSDGPGGAFACSCVRLGALSANRQSTAMAQAAITAKVHQSLDVHGDFAAKITLYIQFRHDATQLFG